MLLVLALLAWSVIGRTDIVVNAQGRIVPRGQTKTLAAVETARVHALHVEEGRVVKAGDLLVQVIQRRPVELNTGHFHLGKDSG